MLRYDVVDVFTDHPFAGNPLAVVHGAEGLTTQQLQAIAAEFNLSETTFPTGVEGGSYSVRIFTPADELPFAGHPTLGTAWVLRRAGLLAEEAVTQHCGAGPIDVRFHDDGVALTAPARELAACPDSVAHELLADLGLGPADQADTAYAAGAGLNFVHLPVHADAVERARIATRPMTAYAELGALGLADPIGGIDLHAVDLGPDHVGVHARVFCPGLSVPEDPATGSSAAGLGMALVARGVLPEGGAYVVRQGIEMGRPSTILGTVLVSDGRAEAISIAGGVCQVASGEIAVPTR